MGRLTDWSYRNPDAVVMGAGVVGGGLLGLLGGGWFGSALGVIFGALLTLAAMHVEPKDGQFGPHH